MYGDRGKEKHWQIKRDTRGDIDKKGDWSSWVFTTSRKFLVHGKKRGHGMANTPKGCEGFPPKCHWCIHDTFIGQVGFSIKVESRKSKVASRKSSAPPPPSSRHFSDPSFCHSFFLSWVVNTQYHHSFFLSFLGCKYPISSLD